MVDGETPGTSDAGAERDADARAAESGEARQDRDALEGIDVVHLHFCYDYLAPSSAGDVVRHLTATDVPLVVTVHDIVYPESQDTEPHRIHTGTLVEAADRVLTLTESAAYEIWVRWGVETVVVPHPPLLTTEEITAAGRRADNEWQGDSPGVVGVLLERLEQTIEGPEFLAEIHAVAQARSGLHLRLIAESTSWDEACGENGVHPVQAAAEAAGVWETVSVVRYEAPDWTLIHGEISALDALVLPYRFGTHSSWLELCRDLGIEPVFPMLGCLREQWFGRQDPESVSGVVYDRRDLTTLAPAVRAALDARLPPPPRIGHGTHDEVMAAHERIYHEVARG